MIEKEKMFYTVAEVLERLNITQRVLSRKLVLYNIETRKLPGSDADYIATRDVQIIEQSIKDPGSIA